MFKCGTAQCGENIQKQRFTDTAGFLGAVQDSDLLNGSGQDGEQMFCGERTVEMYFHHTDFVSFCIEIVYHFFAGIAYGTHGNQYFSGILCTIIVKGFVGCAEFFVDQIHVFHDQINGFLIGHIAGFTMLEKSFRLFRAADQMRMIGI